MGTNLPHFIVAGCISSRKSSGLSLQDHSFLNAHVEGTDQQKRLAEMRIKYNNKPTAQHQIDVYDSSSNYGKELSELREQLKDESKNDLTVQPDDSAYNIFRKQEKQKKKKQ